MKPVHIVDTGFSNIQSVVHALNFLGYTPVVSRNRAELDGAKKIILPGVGSFRRARERLQALELDKALREAIDEKQSQLFGICLGMQLLANASYEHGFTPGLKLIAGDVTKFEKSEGSDTVQNVGFTSISWLKPTILSKGISETTCFYFTHSFKLKPESTPETVAISFNGCAFSSVIDTGDGVFGTQFHPEKSQKQGLRIIENFLLA